jgi:hypothetical protein
MPGYHAGRSPGQERVVFMKPLVSDPRIEVGEYTYYDDPRDPRAVERDAFLYAHGPERLLTSAARLGSSTTPSGSKRGCPSGAVPSIPIGACR